MIEKEETYERLQEFKVMQDKLIAEGKMQKPQIVYGFSPEDRKAFDTTDKTLDEILNNLIQKLW